MIHDDTIKLLRECDAGIKMGVKSIDDVLDKARCTDLRRLLKTCKDEHLSLDRELQRQLHRYGDEGKQPNFIAEKMAQLKTELRLGMDEQDSSIASLMTDGCNMGVKSLSRYLNQYAAADESSKGIAKRLISLESGLAQDMRQFL